jgi:two-component system, OmpR family, sensor histidine kinase MtrB
MLVRADRGGMNMLAAVGVLLGHGARWVGQRAADLATVWRRSLQFRVAATTMVVTGAIVLLIGLFLVDQISNGLLGAKRRAAIAQAVAGLDSANRKFDGVAPGDRPGINQAVDLITSELAANGSNAGLFRIAVRSPDASLDTVRADEPTIPDGLRKAVRRGSIVIQYAPVKMQGQEHLVAGLIVGEPVSTRAGSFELYYLFPLAAEAATISLVQRTVFFAGVALILLVAAIAMLVTRQVVRPVRVAAQTSKRLAGGDLSQRIEVSGEDDIALLGESFNDMADSLQRQIQRLEELSRLQQRFTSDVSHELRTPLTTVRMAAELLYMNRDTFAPELARSVELLTNELDRFENLLADLLEISRFDAGAARLEAESVDLVGVVDRAVRASETLAIRHGIELKVDVGAHPAIAEVDARRIERVLRNLIGNALDHAEGNPVEVRLGVDDHAVAVTVRDHGVGLRPGEAGLVFNRFWRGDPSRSRLTGGTGLGLAISLEDARLHGGWLQAWGERGSGAVFRLTLPRTAEGNLDHSPLPLAPVEVDV